MSFLLPFKYYSVHTVTLIAASTFITWGSYFVYDIPGELFYPLQKWFGTEYDDSKNLALYSAYSWPTVVLAFVGGYIIDRLSVRTGALLFGFLVMCGQLVCTYGVIEKNFWVCILGRLILGSGSESLVVAQNVFVFRWFGSGPALALIFGVLTLVRASSAVGFLILPPLANSEGIVYVIWIGTMVCGASVFMCILTAILDKLGDPILTKRRKDNELDNSQKSVENFAFLSASERRMSLQENAQTGMSRVSIKQIREFPLKFWIFLFLISLLLNSFWSFAQVASDVVQNIGPFSGQYDQLPASEVFAECSDFAGNIPNYFVLHANSTNECEVICSSIPDCSGYQFTLSSLSNSTDEQNCFFFSSYNKKVEVGHNASYVLQAGENHPVRYGNEVQDDSVVCFKRGHQFSSSTASMYAGLPNFVSILSPLFGMFVDRHGKALYVLMLSSVMLILTFVGVLSNALGWAFISPLFLMIWAGFALTFALAVAEPTISVIIAPRLLGTAYGCYTSFLNLFSALLALLVGAVQDANNGTIMEYTFPMYIFIVMAGASGCLCVLILYLEKRSSNGFSMMNSSVTERSLREEGEAFLMKASCDEIF